MLIEAMRRVRDEDLPHAGSSFCSPRARRSACAAPAPSTPSRCAARIGFVYDHSGPVGDIVGSAPSLHRIVATFIGRAAHAGIAPEAGRSAIEAAARAIARMPLGRIDAETTANVGTIAGRHGDERRGGALRGHGRGAQPRRAGARRAAHHDARRADLGRERVRGRPRDPG